MPKGYQPRIAGSLKKSPFQGVTMSTSKSSSSSKPSLLKGNLPIIFGLLFLGVGLILFMRSRTNASTVTGPPLTLVPTTDADASNIQNMLQAIRAATGQVYTPDNATAGGGVSTAIGVVSGSDSSTNVATLPDQTDQNTIQGVTIGGVTIPAGLRTVGALTDITTGQPIGDPRFGTTSATNLSLVDWYKYWIAKVDAARQGTILGESTEFKARTTAEAYLADTLQGGKISMYGPNAGAPQKALDQAALAEALRQLGRSSI